MSQIILTSCGNRRSPTGGPVDDILPEIAYTIPLEYEQIENREIIIAFSKTMDKTSVINGLIISPAYLNKKLSWKKNSLHISFTDELPQDTNILIYLNKTIRCERNNTFEEHKVLTFKNGELQRNSFSGFISFEEENMNNKETHLSLLDRDSLLVFNTDIIGENYSFENLNSGLYTLRAFIDMNKTNRYNFGVDPFFRTSFELPIQELININLVIADTIKPNLRNLSSPANNQVVLSFNKNLAQMPFVSIVDDSTSTAIRIIHKELFETQLFLITAPLDTLKYNVEIENLVDFRGNEREIARSEFTSKGLPDTTPPKIVSTIPRNGTVINQLFPEIFITFNEIMYWENVFITLREIESGQNIPLFSVNTAGFTLQYQPQIELKDFNSYQIIIYEDTKDYAGNEMGEEFMVQFIVVGGTNE